MRHDVCLHGCFAHGAMHATPQHGYTERNEPNLSFNNGFLARLPFRMSFLRQSNAYYFPNSFHRQRTSDDLRWICKSPVLQKWYFRSLRPQLRKQLRPSKVHSYGFRKFTSTSQVIGLVRQIQFLADVWGLPLAIWESKDFWSSLIVKRRSSKSC